AGARAAQGTMAPAEPEDTPANAPHHEVSSIDVGGKLLDFISKIAENPNASADELLADFTSGMQSLGLSAEQIAALETNMRETIIKTKQGSLTPPREVPDGLNAEEYYDLGVRYKEAGWTEQARDALNAAIELDQDGEFGKKALLYRRTKIPLRP